VIDDLLTLLVKARQEELRSTAAEIAQGRRARQELRAVDQRPLHLRLLARVFGPR